MDDDEEWLLCLLAAENVEVKYLSWSRILRLLLATIVSLADYDTIVWNLLSLKITAA